LSMLMNCNSIVPYIRATLTTKTPARVQKKENTAAHHMKGEAPNPHTYVGEKHRDNEKMKSRQTTKPPNPIKYSQKLRRRHKWIPESNHLQSNSPNADSRLAPRRRLDYTSTPGKTCHASPLRWDITAPATAFPYHASQI